MSEAGPQAIAYRIDVTMIDKDKLHPGRPVKRIVDGVEKMVTPQYLTGHFYRRDLKDRSGKVYAHYKVVEDPSKAQIERNKIVAKEKRTWGNDLGTASKSTFQKVETDNDRHY